MRRKVKSEIRELLLSNPEGLTIAEICGQLRVDDNHVRKALPSMPDAYIDRWVKSSGPYAAVWCVVEVPENCPRPAPGYRTEEEKEQQRIRSREHAQRKAQVKREEEERRRELYKLANLTVIRGPWPTANA